MDFNKSSKPGLFDVIRKAFKDVADQAQHVRIRHDKIEAYAKSLKPLLKEEVFDQAHHFIGSPEQTAAFVLILDSINFGGTFKKDLVKEGFALRDSSLYFTMAAKLKEIFENEGGISAAKLATIKTQDCAALFGLTSGPVASKIADLYARSLRELGEFIDSKHGGRFAGVLDSAENSVEKLVGELSDLKSFNDISDYKGIRVPLLKRAQITAADLHLAFEHLGRQLFNDIDKLTTFPDNAVAHVLHEDGLLEYSKDLQKKIEDGIELKAGSEEEIEIRACAGHAVELIRSLRPDLNSMNIDHVLWLRSHEPDYLVRNHHKAMTMFY